MPISNAADLNYRHLFYFWTVATEGHLTRAADRLHLSQSALSAQIRQLEDQLGHALFLREHRMLKLTEVGHLVLGYAETIFSLGGEMVALVQTDGGPSARRLRVGGVVNLSRNFQENFLRPVMDAGVRLILESGGLDELMERLLVHKLDIVLSNRPVANAEEEQIRCRRIARQPVCLVGHPLPSNEAFRFPEDLNRVSLLLPGRNSDVRAEFDMLCERLQVRPEINAEVDDMAMLRLMARDSGPNRAALVPAVVVQDELRSGTLMEYCEVPNVYENFYAITTDRRFQPSALTALLEIGVEEPRGGPAQRKHEPA
jgi:LysR family transcriptional regulator, transcriptional activator of nhaA